MKFSVVYIPMTFAQTFDRYIKNSHGEHCRDACLEKVECRCYDYTRENEVCGLKVYKYRNFFAKWHIFFGENSKFWRDFCSKFVEFVYKFLTKISVTKNLKIIKTIFPYQINVFPYWPREARECDTKSKQDKKFSGF